MCLSKPIKVYFPEETVFGCQRILSESAIFLKKRNL